jgi:hypothetical protein
MAFRITIIAGTGYDKFNYTLQDDRLIPALRSIRDHIAQIAGGYTEYDGTGGWYQGSIAITEPGKTWVVLLDDPRLDAAQALGRELASMIARELQQQSVVLTVESVAMEFVGA